MDKDVNGYRQYSADEYRNLGYPNPEEMVIQSRMRDIIVDEAIRLKLDVAGLARKLGISEPRAKQLLRRTRVSYSTNDLLEYAKKLNIKLSVERDAQFHSVVLVLDSIDKLAQLRLESGGYVKGNVTSDEDYTYIELDAGSAGLTQLLREAYAGLQKLDEGIKIYSVLLAFDEVSLK